MRVTARRLLATVAHRQQRSLLAGSVRPLVSLHGLQVSRLCTTTTTTVEHASDDAEGASIEHELPAWIVGYQEALAEAHEEEDAMKSKGAAPEPIVRVKTVDDKGRAYGTGRRKASIARVWIWPGTGEIKINKGDAETYLIGRQSWLEHIAEPFAVTRTEGKFDVMCTTKGGGHTGRQSLRVLCWS